MRVDNLQFGWSLHVYKIILFKSVNNILFTKLHQNDRYPDVTFGDSNQEYCPTED
jgi:hypothetical protein